MRKQVSVNSRANIARSGSLNFTYFFSRPLLYRVSSLLLGLLWGGAIAYFDDYAWGQVASDNTLGSQVTSPIAGTFLIQGGTLSGTNLFHSFSQFSVPTNGLAYFNNTSNIQNIISRVTGGSVSNIDGLIAANGTANLFLLNPNGITFGANARLNIGGSFLASTASSLNFADGTQFSATPTQTTPLLTVSVPLGLQYEGNAGSIRVQNSNSTLRVPNGKTLALVGGNVQLNDAFLQAPGGRVELGGLAGAGTVALNLDNNNLRLSFPDGVALADVSLSNRTLVDASGNGGGNIQVQGSRITLTNRSGFNADTLASKNGGEIVLRASQLIVRDGSFVSAGTGGTGQGGTVTVNASDFVEVSGTTPDGRRPSGLGTDTVGVGAAGNVNITTQQLIVRGGAVVSAGTRGKGAGGNLTVTATESVELAGTTADSQFPSGLFARTRSDAAGGDLTITTGRLIIRDGATASTSTSGTGKAGDLIVRASEAVEVRGTSANGDPSGLSAQVNPTAKGDGGNLTIQTGRLIVEGGAQVSAATLGKGQGGTLIVNASDFVELMGTSAKGVPSRLTTQTESPKPAGDLRIDTGRLIVRDGAQVEAGTFGEGQGGTLIVNASKFVEVRGISANGKIPSGLFVETSGAGAAGNLRIDTGQLIIRDEALVSARTSGRGQGGNLFVTTGQLDVRDGAVISVNSVGTGRAGNLEISSDSVRLENQGFIVATTLSGDGGNIRLRVKDLLLMRHESELSTTAGTAQAGGDGGNINIDAEFIVAVPKENSDITANAFTGRGGNINITTQGIYGLEFRPRLTPLSDITASSEFGVNGTVQINTPGVDPSRGLANLPVEPVNVEVTQGCQATGKQGSIEFFNTGRGGLASNPYEPLSSSGIWEDVPLPAQEAGNSVGSVSPAVPSNQLVEAQGWLVNDKGEVTLVAEMPISLSRSRCRLR
jgi:filamentous hemagglutinin family protein